MGLILLCILVFLGLVIPKSKGVTTAILIFMWVLFAFNLQSPDRGSYETAYNNLFEVRIYMTNYEPAYTLLMIISRILRLSYVGFRTVLATIYVVLIGVSVKRYTVRTASALALFLIAPFLWYISGLRVAISSAVVAYSFWFLLSNSKKSIIKFCIGIAVATLFHYSACLYLIFLLAKRKILIGTSFLK